MSPLRLCSARLWSAASALALLCLFPVGASAQPTYQQYPPADQDEAYTSSWQQLQQLSARLETLAARARDEAEVDSRHHGSGELAERMDDFAKHAHELRLYTGERGVPASKINDQIRKLMDDARKVQGESVKAKRHDPRTDEDWNRTVAVLDQINNQYLAANGLLSPEGTAGPYRPAPFYRNSVESRRTMVADLDRRADDAARLSEGANLEITSEIERLRDQVRSYQQRMDEFSATDTRANIAHMLADARAIQADLAGSNAPSQLRDDVNSIVGTLVQMRDMNAEGAQGTSGYEQPYATDRDRDRDDYPVVDADFAQDLDARVGQARALATNAAGSDMDDVRSDITHFQDRVRDFENRSTSMSREDRREALDSLLHDAQKTQRDMASHHVSGDLAAQWDGVVDMLLRARDRS